MASTTFVDNQTVILAAWLNDANAAVYQGKFGTGASLGGATNPIVQASQSANNFVQVYVENPQAGVSSSADFVAYANNSTDSHGWADVGFTSSAYADATYTITGPNEAYLFGSAPVASGATGNLVIATDSTGTANAIQFYTNGFTQAKSAAKMTIDANGNVTANAPTGSLGYGTGSGGTVTQLTSKSTTVTLNKPTGQITMNNAALGAGTRAAFTFNNSLIGANDSVIVTTQTFGLNYSAVAHGVSGGACFISVTNMSAGALSEAVVLNFAIIKGAIA